jgi:F0F1-type ATP synthase assembly protein I
VSKNKYIVFAAMGFELVGVMLGCLYIGQLIDQKWNLKGLGIIGFSILGLAGWIIHIVQMSKQIENVKDEESQ